MPAEIPKTPTPSVWPVVLGILGAAVIVRWFVLPPPGTMVPEARITKDMVQARAIVHCLLTYADDHGGRFPTLDENGEPFTNSTDVFNLLIREAGANEMLFYLPDNRLKRVPNMDGVLQPEENCYIYVSGQDDSMHQDSPLVADEMVSPGIYGKNHPWLKEGKAVVGYIGGHARAERLDSRKAPAKVKGPVGTGIDDIFQKASIDSEGRISGGFLAVEPDNILLPETAG